MYSLLLIPTLEWLGRTRVWAARVRKSKLLLDWVRCRKFRRFSPFMPNQTFHLTCSSTQSIIYLSNSIQELSIIPTIYLSNYLSIFRNYLFSETIYFSNYLSFFLYFLLSIFLTIFLSYHPYFLLSIFIFFLLSIFPTIYLSNYLLLSNYISL